MVRGLKGTHRTWSRGGYRVGINSAISASSQPMNGVMKAVRDSLGLGPLGALMQRTVGCRSRVYHCSFLVGILDGSLDLCDGAVEYGTATRETIRETSSGGRSSGRHE